MGTETGTSLERRKEKCPSCGGAVVGAKNSATSFCVNCGAKVTEGRAEPTEAIRAAVRDTLKEFGFEPKKHAEKTEEDDL